MKATKLVFEENYSDDSGVEFGVTYVNEPYRSDGDANGYVRIEHINSISIPVGKVQWFIQCLQEVIAHVEKP